MVVAPPGVAGFGDVGADRDSTEAVQWMVDNDVTTGTSSTCLSPDDPSPGGRVCRLFEAGELPDVAELDRHRLEAKVRQPPLELYVNPLQAVALLQRVQKAGHDAENRPRSQRLTREPFPECV